MYLVYTKHAKEKLEERKILPVYVEETIKWPHLTKYKNNKYTVIRKLNGRTLKVVYTKENYIRIITCFYIK